MRKENRVKVVKFFGVIVSLVTFASLFLPWWSIRASGVSIDVYPFGVRALSFPAYDADWVVGRLLSLDGTLLIVSLLIVVSGGLALAGSLKLPFLLVAPLVLNFLAAFIFYSLMRSALGKLAHGYFSGTNLIPIPGEPWGFVWGIGVCVLGGLAAPVVLIVASRKSELKLE
jgi:hypothetical protein